MSVPSAYFSRRPYTVTYFKDGEKKTIRRVPPPVLHNMLPTDVVKLTHTKNADFKAGDEFTVKNISQRSPNTLQIVDENGVETFVPYFEAELERAVHPHHGEQSIESPQRNRYLLWP